MSAGERCQENGKLPRRQLKLRAIVCHGLPWFAIACECLFCLIFGAHRWNSQVKWNSRILLSFGPYNDKWKRLAIDLGIPSFSSHPHRRLWHLHSPHNLLIYLSSLHTLNVMNQIESNRMGSTRFGLNQLCALRGVNVLWNDLLFDKALSGSAGCGGVARG